VLALPQVDAWHDSGVVVSQVRAEGNREGIRTYGSSLEIVDSDFCDNSRGGLYLGNGSSVIIDGEEIRASGNGSFGLLLSEAALRSPWPTGGRLVTNDNPFAGVVLQGGAALLMGGPLEAKRNGAGVRVIEGRLSATYGLDASDCNIGVLAAGPNADVDVASLAGGADASVAGNTVDLYAGEGGYISFNGILTGNTGAAVIAEGAGRVALSSTDCQGNGSGLNVHGGTASIQESTIAGNTNGDVDLSFGARATFDGTNVVGVVVCDGTVLVEGDVTCPETKGETASPSLMERVGLPGLLSSDFPASEWIP